MENKTETLWTQFWVTIYIDSECNLYEKNKQVISSILDNNYITSEFNFCKNLPI